jgi:hypothetical protein
LPLKKSQLSFAWGNNTINCVGWKFREEIVGSTMHLGHRSHLPESEVAALRWEQTIVLGVSLEGFSTLKYPTGQEQLRDIIFLHPLLKDDLKLPAAPGRDKMQAEVESSSEQ